VLFRSQELGGALAEIDAHQSLVAPDTVLDMNHRVARLELGEVADDRIDIGDRLAAPPAPAPRRTDKEFGLGKDDDAGLVAREPVDERAGGESDRILAGDE